MVFYNIHEDAWDDYCSILDAHKRGGLESFRKALRSFANNHCLDDLFGSSQRALFARRSAFLYCHELRSAHATSRRQQMLDEGLPWLVYRALDCDLAGHSQLDGLCLPSAHSLWKNYMPMNGFGCACSLSGSHSERGARRLGATHCDPPEWTSHREAETGLLRGIQQGFMDNAIPDRWDTLVAASGGLAD